ncbi:MAG: transcription antitermination factor NusB [Alphaproteobacteria bacterium]|nr:transcription antitermination factor NusB [Alphaproteobacteria bacterium]
MSAAGTDAAAAPARRAARLAAVQSLYQMELTGASPRQAIAEFVGHRLGTPTAEATGEEGGEVALQAADRLLFAAIVEGVKARADDLDGMIGSALSGEWRIERLEVLLRAILRAGTFELFARPETPAAIIINDYVDVAHAFFSQKEPGLVNAVLDRLAHGLRPDAADERRARTTRAR